MPLRRSERMRQWQAHHEHLVAFLGRSDDDPLRGLSARDVSMFRRMQHIFQNIGSLTVAQTDAVQRLYDRMRATPIAEVPMLVVPATRDTATWIRNGNYVLVDQFGASDRYQIYTVSRGPLTGKRIIKRETEGRFMGFAFLNSDGSFSLWRRFNGEARNHTIIRGRKLLELLNSTYAREQVAAGNMDLHFDASGGWTIRIIAQCRGCNRRLQDVVSLREGLDADCRPDATVLEAQLQDAIEAVHRPLVRRARRRNEPEPSATPGSADILDQIEGTEIL
jgi:hypothetical protein